MRFGPPAPLRQPRENVVPMINVVFLLLIFFMLAARLSPPDPFDVAPPEGAAAAPLPDDGTLYLSAEGQMAFAEARGDDVFLALRAWAGDGPLPVRADAGLSAETLAGLLPRLAAVGVPEISLATAPSRPGSGPGR